MRWDRLAGDTDVFALRMAFARDPDEGRGADPLASLAWGEFQIWVEGRNLCSHLEGRERIDSVHWYLLPVIEWFARNWDPLLHEERLPVENADGAAWRSLQATRFPPPAIEEDEPRLEAWESAWQNWWRRHALRSSREGGLFPDVVFRRARDRVEVSWGPVASEERSCRFSGTESPGFVRLPPQAVAEPLHEVLSGACQHLRSPASESERIRNLGRELHTLRTERRGNRRLTWLAGLGTDARTVRDRWVATKKSLKQSLSGFGRAPLDAMFEASQTRLVVTGSCQAALIFGSLAPDVKSEDVLTLARIMVELHAAEGHSAGNPMTVGEQPVEGSMSHPWSQGYALAEELHDNLDGRFIEDGFVDITGLVGHFGVTLRDCELTDASTRGVSIAGPRHRPAIVVNRRNPMNQSSEGRRFTLAHELCHLLFDRDAGQRLAVASGPWAPRETEQRANAFAAMLLMPTRLVQRAISNLTTPLASGEGVRAVSKALRSSPASVLPHLKNLGFLNEGERQQVEQQLALPDPKDSGRVGEVPAT